jgi:hypothetical protein
MKDGKSAQALFAFSFEDFLARGNNGLYVLNSESINYCRYEIFNTSLSGSDVFELAVFIKQNALRTGLFTLFALPDKPGR